MLSGVLSRCWRRFIVKLPPHRSQKSWAKAFKMLARDRLDGETVESGLDLVVPKHMASIIQRRIAAGMDGYLFALPRPPEPISS